MPTILLAITGLSPAVLTETIWALARQPEPVVPDRVIVVTTAMGREQIHRRLFAPGPLFAGMSPWQALREDLAASGHDLAGKLRFGQTGDDIRVITTFDPTTGLTRELEDIRSPSDHQTAADFLLHSVRHFAESPDTRIVASLAGGRKTMSALLYACLSLIGRDDDIITHVLVSEPYEAMADFWFPSQKTPALRSRTGEEYRPDQAKVELAEVPFVPLRNLFQKELGHPPGSFSGLVDFCSANVRLTAGENLRIEVAPQRGHVVVNGKTVPLTPREMFVFLFLARRAKHNEVVLSAYDEAIVAMEEFRTACRESAPAADWSDWRHASFFDKPMNTGTLARILSELRARFKNAGGDAALLASLLPIRGRCSLDVPGAMIYLNVP